MNIISFSLWGHDEKYFKGAYRNCELAQIWYPDWTCLFYVRGDSNPEFIENLENFSNSSIIKIDSKDERRGLFWRFLPAFDTVYDVTLVRDCDSRLSEREALAVDEWLASDRAFHIMRDHPYHNTEILGGMWGVKNKKIDLGSQLTLDEIATYKDEYQEDQKYLRERIWPLVKNQSFVHDEFFGGSKFPSPRKNYDDFVGQQYDQHDNPVKENSQILRNHLEKSK